MDKIDHLSEEKYYHFIVIVTNFHQIANVDRRRIVD
jgi:hypothetical protein